MKKLLLGPIIAVFVLSCQWADHQDLKKLNEPVASLFNESLKPFYHGVASGDPLSDRVIIWTRVTPTDSVSRILVTWEISRDSSFSTIDQHDTLSTTPLRDYTVKVDVKNLNSGTDYYYRFKALERTSMVGHTRTFPTGSIDHLKFAVVSCANWEFGYFNAFARIAEKDVDAVLHLGDYIYEYASGKYGNKDSDRKNIPLHEVVTLSDYRTRYSQYHLDEGLRKARQAHPFITIWDDHEVANDVYTEGAQNHQADEGDFQTRKRAAQQAYHEWIPIRDGEKHYRSFAFGNLADVIMLDERLEGRVKPFDSVNDPAYKKEYHSMLGKTQLGWFEEKLKKGRSWKIVGNQVLFSDFDQSLADPTAKKSMDSWAGYPLEQKEIADFIIKNKISDVILLSGDTHSSWAFEATLDPKAYNATTSAGAFAVELGTTSITSGNANEFAPNDQVIDREQKLLKSNHHLKFVNLRDHGYLLLTITPEVAKAEWYYVETLMKVDPAEHLAKTLTFKKGTHTLK